MDKTKRRLSAIVVLTSILVLGVLALATGIASAESAKEELPAADIQAVIEEIDEHVHELINGTMALHDNTEQIADNETLDEDLRAKAEEVHVASHELLYIAEDIQELVDELEDLGKDLAANKAEMGEAIVEIKEHLGDYTEALDANHDLVADILSTVPETHKVYAEATQDAMYGLESTVEEIEEHIEELQGLLEDGAAEIQEAVEELQGDASQLKRLTRKMNKPAHAIPGDIGEKIHGQFHRIEAVLYILCENVEELEELAEEPEKNKAEMRELVVEDLYGQLGRVQMQEQLGRVGEVGKALAKMREFTDEVLSTNPELADAQKLQDTLDEFGSIRDDALDQVMELRALLQVPIVWEYPKSMGAANSHRLENGNTLISESGANRVIEVTPDREIVWKYSEGLEYPWGVQRLENGNTLIAAKDSKRVVEVTPDKEIAWEYSSEEFGYISARRLGNGNTLMAEYNGQHIIEVTPGKEVVWEYCGDNKGVKWPGSIQRLENGNTLITAVSAEFAGRVIEVTQDKEIAWEYSSEELIWPYGAQRLPNGHTLIADCMGDRVIEVTSAGETVWEYAAIPGATDVERLENGNTLITVYVENRVIEVGAP